MTVPNLSIFSSDRFSSDRLPWAGFIAALVCLALEALILTLQPHFISGLDFTVSDKRQMMTDPSRQEDVLILGDSRFFSIRPDIVDQAFGGSLAVTNYTWPFAGVETVDYFLEAYLRYKKPPKAILAGWMPESFAVSAERMSVTADPLYRTRLFNVVPAVPLATRFARDGHWKMLWDLFEYRALPPSAHHRARLIPFVLASVGAEPATIPESEDRRIAAEYQGAQSFLLYRDEVASPDAVSDYDKAAGGLKLDAALGNLPPLRRFLERARSSGIRVILFNVPIPEGLHQRFDELGVIAKYDEVIAGLQQEFENFEVIEPTLQIYPDGHFADVGHMNGRGDQQFAGHYGQAMTRWLEEHGSGD
jgi:hypothetical protein